jgi:hypothetical protein
MSGKPKGDGPASKGDGPAWWLRGGEGGGGGGAVNERNKFSKVCTIVTLYSTFLGY